MHAQRPDEALSVAGKDRSFSGGVDLDQPAAEGGLALGVELGLNGVADLDRDRRNFGQPPGQSVEVEARAPNQQGGATLSRQFGQHVDDRPAPTTDGPSVSGVGDAIEAVRDFSLVFYRRSGAQHAQVGVELLAVGVDDDGVRFARALHRQARLARSGGAGDQGDERLGQRINSRTDA
ncbi:hypothetical protein D3C73_1105700 [compost metagenome]